MHQSDNPLVAVIIPVYNGSAFIQDAIRSVLDQDLDQLELIVIDDGSTDDTVDMVRRFPEVQLYTQERRGANTARNLGIARSRAPFIKFLDADDYLEPGILKKQVELAATLPAHVIPYGYARVFGAQHKSVIRKCILGDDHVESLILRNINTPLPLHRRALLEQIGGFNEALRFGQEKNLHIRLALAGYRFFYHDDCTVHIRSHQQSTRISNRIRVVEEDLKNLEFAFADYLNFEPFRYYDAFACHVWRIGRSYELANEKQGAALLYARAEEIAHGDFKRYLSRKEKLLKKVNGPRASKWVRTIKNLGLYVMDRAASSEPDSTHSCTARCYHWRWRSHRHNP
jgi:glycosyltransferase involved in cell wall biosynthesis